MRSRSVPDVTYAPSPALHVRCVGLLDSDLVDALMSELVAALRDERWCVVVDLRLARPGSAADVQRLVRVVGAARERGLAVDMVGRPRDWLAALATAGFNDVLLVTTSLAKRGVVLVGRRAA